MSAHSFLIYASIYYMPGTVPGTQAKSEANKTDCPSAHLILGNGDSHFTMRVGSSGLIPRKQDLSKDLMGTKGFVCLVGMLEKDIPEMQDDQWPQFAQD